MLILVITLFLASLNLSCSGDGVSNPGPAYSVTKIIWGSFHQDDPRFGYTAEIQCVCNSPYVTGKLYQWNTNGLDRILTGGDLSYKSLGTSYLHWGDEFLRSVIMITG